MDKQETTEQQETQVEATETATEEEKEVVDTNTYEEEIKALKQEIEGYKAQEKVNVENSIKLEIIKAGLDQDYFEIVAGDDVESAKAKIRKLQELHKQNKIDNSYKPSNHKADDEYSKAESKGDTKSMIKSKLSGLFQ